MNTEIYITNHQMSRHASTDCKTTFCGMTLGASMWSSRHDVKSAIHMVSATRFDTCAGCLKSLEQMVDVVERLGKLAP